MKTTHTLLPTAAAAEELISAGVNPEAKREVPGLGYIQSDAAAVGGRHRARRRHDGSEWRSSGRRPRMGALRR